MKRFDLSMGSTQAITSNQPMGWIKKGERKEISTSSGRARLNLSGVIDMIEHKVFIQEDQTLSGESTLRFLEKIEQAYPLHQTIHLFCDHAPYDRNVAVKKHLENSKIKLHFLPLYSPHLNPIERLWKWMKERVDLQHLITENLKILEQLS